MADNSGVAPVCNAKAVQPTFTQVISPIPAFSVPNFKEPGANAIILQLQHAIQSLTAALPANNTVPGVPMSNVSGGDGGALGGGGGGKSPPQDQGDWIETSRQTQTVKVVNPDDDSQFVIVKEITQLVFERESTGEKITIKRDP